MSIANYTDLQSSIASWMHRSDLTSVIPDFVALCEARISRDLRLRRQVIPGTLATVAGTRSVTLPTDFLEAENVSILNGDVEQNLEYATIERIGIKYPDGAGDGVPQIYSYEDSNIILGPTPDAVYTVNLYYYAKIDALSTTATNWLLTNHPNIYLFGSLAEAGDYVQSDALVQKWEAKYKKGITELMLSDNNSMYGGSTLRVRTV